MNTNEIKKQIEDKDFKWYVLSVTSGQEALVIENSKRIKKQGLAEDVIDYLSPMVMRLQSKKGRKSSNRRNSIRVCVLFKSRMNDTWYVVEITPWSETYCLSRKRHQFRFLMLNISRLWIKLLNQKKRSELTIPYKEGDIVLLKNGDFKGMK